ncbi:MAG: outer membrane beta-barrel domain-containing protein [Oligoflexales bacterium]|nr:outer membrane beta-barrel domain-containing protein [Oligoflexales bacterium]
MLQIRWNSLTLLFFLSNLLFLSTSPLVADQIYRKATDSDENVKNKLFPKAGRIEFGLPSYGIILNQSFVDTSLIHGAISYFWSESWGVGIEGAYAMNKDKDERYCIEHFYNDPNELVSNGPCAFPGDDPAKDLQDGNGNAIKGASIGPAYTRIRELNLIAAASLIWNPIYGKQLAFLSFTNHFDIFMTFGLGLAMSDLYPESHYLKNGNPARGPVPSDFPGCPPKTGVCPSSEGMDDLIGANGRPAPETVSSPTLTLGIGQKFHFLKHFHLKAEIRNYTLLDTPTGYENLFALWLGLGFRF